MSRDQGPQDTLITRNGGNTVSDGECLPRELPEPTNAGDWLPLEPLEAIASWVLITICIVCLAMAAGFFFNR